jgi:hypothetical protein
VLCGGRGAAAVIAANGRSLTNAEPPTGRYAVGAVGGSHPEADLNERTISNVATFASDRHHAGANDGVDAGRVDAGARARLRRYAAALRAGTLSVDAVADDLDALANGIAGPVIETIKASPGHDETFKTSKTIARRDALLRQAAEKFFPKSGCSLQAAHLEQALDRFRATDAWRREQSGPCPATYTGTLRVFLFEILKVCGDEPPRSRTIRRILATPD